MSLAEKFPKGFPENLGEGKLVFLRDEIFGDPTKNGDPNEEMTAQRMMTSLYNLIFYNPEDCQLYFEKDAERGVVNARYVEENEFTVFEGISFLKTAYLYFISRRSPFGVFESDPWPVISMFVEFRSPIPEADVWRGTVYRAPLSRAAIYVAPDLKPQAEKALEKIDQLRRGETITLD